MPGKASFKVFNSGDTFEAGGEATLQTRKREERKVLEQSFEIFIIQDPKATKAEMLAFIAENLGVPFDIEKEQELLKWEKEGGVKNA